jgi:hypothetical protein
MASTAGVTSSAHVVRSALFALVLVFGWCSPAWADSFGGELHYVTGVADLDGREIDVPAAIDEPTLLEGKTLRLHGRGTLQGVAFRGEFLIDSWRLGYGWRMYGIDDASITSDQLPWGTSVRADRMWAITSDLFVGYEIGQGPVYPYLDGVFSLAVLDVQVETHAEPYGHVGTTAYTDLGIGFGPRFGALIPVGHSLMLDVAIQQRLIGGWEQTLLFVGVGYWENDRDDPFSSELKGGWRGDL